MGSEVKGVGVRDLVGQKGKGQWVLGYLGCQMVGRALYLASLMGEAT